MVEERHEEFNKIHTPRERAGKKDMKKGMKKDEDRGNKGSIDS